MNLGDLCGLLGTREKHHLQEGREGRERGKYEKSKEMIQQRWRDRDNERGEKENGMGWDDRTVKERKEKGRGRQAGKLQNADWRNAAAEAVYVCKRERN